MYVSGQLLSQHTTHVGVPPTPCEVFELDPLDVRPQPAFSSAVYGHVGLHLVGGTSTKAIRYRPVEGGARHVSQPEEVVELEDVCPVSGVPAAHHQEEVLEARARPQPRQLEGLLVAAVAAARSCLVCVLCVSCV